MPESAIRNVKVDHILPLTEIGPLLVRLATKRTNSKPAKGTSVMEKRSLKPDQMVKKFGPPVPFVCPECNGTLWEQKNGRAIEFRCHVGHAFSPDSLLADNSNELEKALWNAIRMFEERAALVRRLKKQGFESPYGKSLESRARNYETHADAIRKVLQAGSAA
jgi:two-component system, chemotaxis family, protein-glutamate methylesterase/glutaminase